MSGKDSQTIDHSQKERRMGKDKSPKRVSIQTAEYGLREHMELLSLEVHCKVSHGGET